MINNNYKKCKKITINIKIFFINYIYQSTVCVKFQLNNMVLFFKIKQ